MLRGQPFRIAPILWAAIIFSLAGFGETVVLAGDTQVQEKQIKNSITWWGRAAVELHLSGEIILIDPYFPMDRYGNVILLTHAHSDHTHLPTLQNIAKVSGDSLNLVVGAQQCWWPCKDFAFKKSNFSERWKTIGYQELIIETIPSYEDMADLGYVIRDPQSGLSVLHMGDNTKDDEVFAKIRNIDYLLLAMGKMSYDDMIHFIKRISPKYLIPIHYYSDHGGFVEQGFSHPSPPGPMAYIEELKKKMQENGIATKVLILQPGQELLID